MAIRRTPRSRLRFLTGVVWALASVAVVAREAAPGSAALPPSTLLVFAAASLTDALGEADRVFSAAPISR